MPRTKRSTFAELVEIASEQHGFVRVEDATEHGINPVYLRQLVPGGVLERESYGLYRLSAYARTAHDEFHRAVLLGGPGSVIIGESAILLTDLADVNPRSIEVGVPKQVRRKGLGNMRFRIRTIKPDDIELFDNIPVLVTAAAIGEMIATGSNGELVEQAIRNAQRRDLIGELTAARLRVKLAERTPRGKKS